MAGNRDMFLPNPFPPFQPESSRPGEQQRLTDWGLLAKGKTIGKSVNFPFVAASIGGGVSIPNASPSNMLELRGPDEQAIQFCLTLAPPQLFVGTAVNAVNTDNVNNLSGSSDNISVTDVVPGGAVGGRVTGANTNIPFANPVASIEWGCGGVSARVEADFANGLCLNLVGSFVRVRAFAESSLTAPGMLDRYFQVGAFIGPGDAKPNNAQRTMLSQNSAGAVGVESAFYTVPRYAKAVHLCGANAAHDVYVGTIRFYRSPLAANFVCDYIFAGNTPGPIPIPNGAYYFTIVNGIADPLSQMAVFQLAV